MPKLLLISFECVVETGRDHVFYANDAGRLLWRIVEDALADFVVEMSAVVIGFYRIASRFVIVGVKGVEMGADALDRLKVLSA